MYLWPSSAQHNQISTTQRIGLILLCCANSVVLGLVFDHCVMFLLCCSNCVFCSLFPLCGYNFVVVRLVSVVLWRFYCFVLYCATALMRWHTLFKYYITYLNCPGYSSGYRVINRVLSILNRLRSCTCLIHALYREWETYTSHVIYIISKIFCNYLGS